MPFFPVPHFGRYSYSIDADSVGDAPRSSKDGLHSANESSRPSEDQKSTSSSADRNHDRFRNAPFKRPEPFNAKTHARSFHITRINKYEVKGNFKSVAISQLSTTSYSALSYTWGTANTEQDIHRIILCGQSFYIRESLWKFFTKTSEQWNGRLLYIDAICIDQRNPLERSDQVKLMPEIYQHANRVCVWLGSPYQDEHKKQLETFSDRLAQDKLSNLLAGRSWNPDALFGLAHLCSRTYWTRLWVVQELLLAGNVAIMYGKMRFERDDVTRPQRKLDESDASMDQALSWWSAWVFNPPKTNVHQSHADDHIEHGWESGWHIMYRRTAWKDASKRRSGPDEPALQRAARNGFFLYHAVNYFSSQQCQDLRDKVYALLALLEPTERDGIQPDYESSPAKVYGLALKVGLRALQRDVEPQALAKGQYPEDRYRDFAGDLRSILRLKEQDVESHTNEAFHCKTFRDAFERNCQREHGLNWRAHTFKSLAEVESSIINTASSTSPSTSNPAARPSVSSSIFRGSCIWPRRPSPPRARVSSITTSSRRSSVGRASPTV